MTKKCYDCKHRGTVPGSAHSSCRHPACKTSGNMLTALFEGSLGIYPPELNIKANPYGVKSGWFMFPMNFDPTWLENCDGFEEK